MEKTVLMFERFVLTKELNDKIKKVGDVFEIANISETSFLLRDSQTRVAVGVVSFEDFESHFVREEEFNGWTPWTPLAGVSGHTDAFYRTNRRRVQVRFLTEGVRSEACCNTVDDFNLFFGIQLAYIRCMNKALEKEKKKYEDELYRIKAWTKHNNKIVKKMLDSLED